MTKDSTDTDVSYSQGDASMRFLGFINNRILKRQLCPPITESRLRCCGITRDGISAYAINVARYNNASWAKFVYNGTVFEINNREDTMALRLTIEGMDVKEEHRRISHTDTKLMIAVAISDDDLKRYWELESICYATKEFSDVQRDLETSSFRAYPNFPKQDQIDARADICKSFQKIKEEHIDPAMEEMNEILRKTEVLHMEP